MLAGAAYHDERAWERTAWLAANVINVAGKVAKRPVTVDKLLGRRSKVAPSQFPNDPQAAFSELVRRQTALESAKANGKD
jgi:hypothetical protein